jgi:hypothetical protein
MNERNQSNPVIAHLARMNCTLEAERNALFDALTGLLQHMELSAAGRAGLQAPLVCGVPIDDRCLEAAVKHALFVCNDESTAAAARTARGQGLAAAMQ